MSIETIANRLARANDFVQVAIEVCAMTRELFEVVECGVGLHAPGGRPTLAVDNLRLPSDEPRLQWLAGAWERDPLHRELIAMTAPVEDGAHFIEFARRSGYTGPTLHMLLLPLIYPRGLLGHIRCGKPAPFSAEARRDLQTLATAASVRLTELHVQPGDDPRLARLTARQRDVARLAGKGMSNAEIGRTLDLSHNTIKKHLKDVFETLGVTSRAQLAVIMCDIGPVHDYPFGITRVDDITIMRGAL
ncbi:MAG TPA: LuxR C-terminal-related transcriptional regulator [Kofleriaceae bacterium]|nr:LuxR C-terminal-related transcriptional regulator [Kofleriaceae bacterium]